MIRFQAPLFAGQGRVWDTSWSEHGVKGGYEQPGAHVWLHFHGRVIYDLHHAGYDAKLFFDIMKRTHQHRKSKAWRRLEYYLVSEQTGIMPNYTTTAADGEVDLRMEKEGPGSWPAKTVFQVFEETVQKHGPRPALHYKKVPHVSICSSYVIKKKKERDSLSGKKMTEYKYVCIFFPNLSSFLLNSFPFSVRVAMRLPPPGASTPGPSITTCALNLPSLSSA